MDMVAQFLILIIRPKGTLRKNHVETCEQLKQKSLSVFFQLFLKSSEMSLPYYPNAKIYVIYVYFFALPANILPSTDLVLCTTVRIIKAITCAIQLIQHLWKIFFAKTFTVTNTHEM